MSKVHNKTAPILSTKEQERALEAFTRTIRASLNEAELQHRPVQIARDRAKNIGLSNCFNLHASFTTKLWKNGEGIAFASESGYSILGNKSEDDPKQGRKTGSVLHQGKLSSHGRRCLRVVSTEYARMVQDKELCAREGWRAFCSFQSLTFRKIGPKDHKQAKDIFRNYLQRWYKARKKELHYAWCAENQKGKELSGGKKSYRLETGEEMIHFHVMSPEFIELDWQTKNWNECVANSFLKHGQIDRLQYQQWLNELDEWLAWRKRMGRYAEMTKAGTRKRGKPKSPGIGDFMLTPNVRAVWSAGRYMAKYMSKQGEELKGHLWSVSRLSRELTRPVVTKKKFHHIYAAGELVNVIRKAVRLSGGFSFKWTDYNDNPGFWTPQGAKILEAYFAIDEQYDIDLQKGTFTAKDRAPTGRRDHQRVLQFAGNT